MTRFLGSDASLALKEAKRTFKEARSLQIIDEGQENLVIVVDDAFVARFPRSEEVWERGATERRVLGRLSTADLPVPKILKVFENPAYIVTSYLQGSQLSTSQLRSLSASQQETIGKDVARVAFRLHESLPVQEFESLIQPPSWSYNDYLKRELFDKTNPNPHVDALAKEYYQKWMNKPKGSREVIIHDDLHMGNLLFDERFKISGILDFGAVCVGTAEQELRQTYRLGEAGFEAAMAAYEAMSGLSLNRDLAKLWTVTQELASYCRDDTDSVHERARENLEFWFPGIFDIK